MSGNQVENSLAKYAQRPPAQTLTGVVLNSASEPRDISLVAVCSIVGRRKLVVLICLALAFLFGGIYCILAPRRYEATARVVINSENSNPLGIAIADGPLPLQDTSLVQETQVRILQSDAVARDVIQQLRLDRNKELAGEQAGAADSFDNAAPAVRQRLLAAFHDRLRVRSVPKTQMVEVSFRSVDPRLAADIVNGVAKAYVERNFRTRFNATAQASDWLARQLDDLKNRVESKQEEFIEFQKKTGIVGTDESHNIVVSRLDELNKHLASVQAERIVREARYRQALNAGAEVIVELAPSSALQILRGQEAELNSDLAQLTAKYGNSYPKVVQLRTQLAQVGAALQAETRNVQQRLETEYRAAAKAEAMAQAEVERQKQEAYKLNEAGIHYLILKRELEGNRDLYEDLQKKLKEAGIVAGLKSTNVNVVDAAEIPVRPAEPRIPLALTLATLLGGICGLGLAFGMESLDTRIGDPRTAEEMGELPVLGVIPRVRFAERERVRQRECVLAIGQSAFAESFRVLRSTLTSSALAKPAKVLLVTSALPEEGKTLVSTNLAVALAQSGRQVLLVDADMRRSPLHQRLCLPQSEGLSDALAGKIGPDAAVVTLSEVPGLHIVPAGMRPAAPAELLQSSRMHAFLGYWREKYDHIVIDAAPVLGLSDAIVLSALSDSVVLVARHRRTGRQSLCRTRECLARVGVTPVGLIFNDLDVNSSQYHDYYGYYGRTYSRYYDHQRKENAALP